MIIGDKIMKKSELRKMIKEVLHQGEKDKVQHTFKLNLELTADIEIDSEQYRLNINQFNMVLFQKQIQKQIAKSLSKYFKKGIVPGKGIYPNCRVLALYEEK